MAAYAVRDDVLARAGRFQGVFSVAGKRPNLGDLDLFLDDVSAIIDVEIRARGYDPDLLTVEIKDSLRDVAAWAVLLRALPEASPGSDEIEPTLDRARAILNAAGFPSLAEGGAADVFVALEALEAGTGGGGPGTSAGSFLADLEDELSIAEEEEIDSDTVGPQWRRGQSL